MTHQAGIFRMVQMRRLDPADTRLFARMAVLEVVDVVVRGDVARAFDELVGDAAQPLHLVVGEDVGNDDGAGLVVLLDLGPAQHGYLRCTSSTITPSGPRMNASRVPGSVLQATLSHAFGPVPPRPTVPRREAS